MSTKASCRVSNNKAGYRVAFRRREVSRLIAAGKLAYEIARELKVHVNTIYGDAKAILGEWSQERIADRDRMVAEETIRLQAIREECLDAYRNAENHLGEKKQVGYLNTYLAATKQLHELWNLRDPMLAYQLRMMSSSKESVDTTIVEVVLESREQLERFRGTDGIVTADAWKDFISAGGRREAAPAQEVPAQ